VPKPPRTYERLSRPATSFGSYRSLWLAADHLLLVTSTGYSEDYQRLQFSDIRGFFVIPSDRRLYWHMPWVICALFSALFMVNTLYSGSLNPPVISGTILGLSVVFFVWNQLMGPTCSTFVITGVQTAPLPSLVRLRKTRKVLARIEPLIAAAQSAIAPPPLPPEAPVPAL
jgi:hypothetical protein